MVHHRNAIQPGLLRPTGKSRRIMKYDVYQVDAFTGNAFCGNPAAVCLPGDTVSEEWMQSVAREMNLSETAFLRKKDDGTWLLRWFTPTQEVDLCGHATVAAAQVLWNEKEVTDDELVFHTRSGQLSARMQEGGIELNFPAEMASSADAPANYQQVIGLPAVDVLANRFDLMVVLQAEDEVRELNPVLHEMKEWPFRGVIVTAQAEGGYGYDFVSRFFAPAVGVPEDPVTGSAHCALIPYWSDWSDKVGRDEVTGYQASERGGYVRGRHIDDRVFLTGEAVTVCRGELLL